MIAPFAGVLRRRSELRFFRRLPPLSMDAAEGGFEVFGCLGAARRPRDIALHGAAGEGMSELVGDLSFGLAGALKNRGGGVDKVAARPA